MRITEKKAFLDLILSALVLAILSLPSTAVPSNKDCMMCHEDPELTDEEGSSIFVDSKTFQRSVHEGLDCVSCHSEFATVEDFPHELATSSVKCTECHDEEGRDYLRSVHGKGYARSDPNAPSCKTCHGKHDIQKASSPHSRIFLKKLKDICMSCHTDQVLEERHDLPLPSVIKAYETSVHGKALVAGKKAVAICSDCHGSHNVKPSDDPKSVSNRLNIPSTCGKCHRETLRKFLTGVHGISFEKGDPDVPICTDCHGEHTIASPNNPASKVFPQNLVKVCARCHTDSKLTEKHHLREPSTILAYERSVHSTAMTKSGLSVVAVCSSCHGTHEVRPAEDPLSSVNRKNIPETCAACHRGIYDTFIKSVHGEDFMSGNLDVPVCTDCHGEHFIGSHNDKRASVFTTNIASMCSGCHDNEGLNRKYGLPSARMASYLGSYHGTASDMGDVTVANCGSCHGYHDIRPSSDPRSSIHPSNIVKTCSKCHIGVDKKFVLGRFHSSGPEKSSMVAEIIATAYKALIACLMMGFLSYIGSDLLAKRRERKKASSGEKMPKIIT